jgi:hypothetical protein
MNALCLAAAAAAALGLAATAAQASDCEPVAIKRVAPSFIPDGLTNRDHVALISYRIGADGRPADIRVTDQNADPRFVQASTDAVHAWRWNVRACSPDPTKTYSIRFTYLPTADDELKAAVDPQPAAKKVDVAAAQMGPGALSPGADALRREVLAHGQTYGLRDGMPYLEFPAR